MPDKDATQDTGPSVADIYREQYAHFRSMNDILYRMPPLFSVAIGGLWFFGASQMRADKVISVGVFLFAAVLAASSVFVMGRFGLAFNGYIDNLNKLDGPFKVTLKRDAGEKPSQPGGRNKSGWKADDFSTVRVIQALLGVACALSIAAAIYVTSFLSSAPAPTA